MNGLASCLHYGQQAFEGLRAWRGPDGEINVFRPKDHARRMAQSCAAVAMPAPSEQLFLECLRQVIVANSHLVPPHGHAASLYIRPFVLGTGPQMAPVPPHEFTFYVFIAPVSPYLGTTAVDAVIVEEFDRAAPRGTGAVKVGGNYAPTMRWSEQARREGYGMTLHLDSLSHSYIDEFSTSAFIGMLLDDEGNRTLVVTDSDNVIESFTADSCVALAREAGWAVEKRPVGSKSYKRSAVVCLLILCRETRFHAPSWVGLSRSLLLKAPLLLSRSAPLPDRRRVRDLNMIAPRQVGFRPLFTLNYRRCCLIFSREEGRTLQNGDTELSVKAKTKRDFYLASMTLSSVSEVHGTVSPSSWFRGLLNRARDICHEIS